MYISCKFQSAKQFMTGPYDNPWSKDFGALGLSGYVRHVRKINWCKVSEPSA